MNFFFTPADISRTKRISQIPERILFYRKKPLAAKASGFHGADDGNRTRVTGLGSECSAIELRLRDESIIAQRTAFVNTFSDGDAD